MHGCIINNSSLCKGTKNKNKFMYKKFLLTIHFFSFYIIGTKDKCSKGKRNKKKINKNRDGKLWNE